MDRNERAKQEFQHRHALQQFARVFQAGGAPPLDRFQNQILIGSLLAVRVPFEILWQVKEIKPVLDLSQPSGFVQLELVSTIKVNVQAGRPDFSIIQLGFAPSAEVPESEQGAVGVPEGGESDSATAATAPLAPSAIILTDPDAERHT